MRLFLGVKVVYTVLNGKVREYVRIKVVFEYD